MVIVTAFKVWNQFGYITANILATEFLVDDRGHLLFYKDNELIKAYAPGHWGKVE